MRYRVDYNKTLMVELPFKSITGDVVSVATGSSVGIVVSLLLEPPQPLKPTADTVDNIKISVLYFIFFTLFISFNENLLVILCCLS